MTEKDSNTPNTPDEMVEVIRHEERGGEVEWATLCVQSVWREKKQDSYNFIAHKYRKKPEPLMLWVNIEKNGIQHAHKSVDSAKQIAGDSGLDYSRIAMPMIEVEEL